MGWSNKLVETGLSRCSAQHIYAAAEAPRATALPAYLVKYEMIRPTLHHRLILVTLAFASASQHAMRGSVAGLVLSGHESRRSYSIMD